MKLAYIPPPKKNGGSGSGKERSKEIVSKLLQIKDILFTASAALFLSKSYTICASPLRLELGLSL